MLSSSYLAIPGLLIRGFHRGLGRWTWNNAKNEGVIPLIRRCHPSPKPDKTPAITGPFPVVISTY